MELALNEQYSTLFFLAGKLAIAGVLGLGGVTAMVLGFRMHGARAQMGNSSVEFSIGPKTKIHIKSASLGGWLVATSWVWAACAYFTTPKSFAITPNRTDISYESQPTIFDILAGKEESASILSDASALSTRFVAAAVKAGGGAKAVVDSKAGQYVFDQSNLGIVSLRDGRLGLRTTLEKDGKKRETIFSPELRRYGDLYFRPEAVSQVSGPTPAHVEALKAHAPAAPTPSP